jgi:hypothetical protein
MSKRKNPTIEELQRGDEFDLEGELDHRQIRDFVLEQLTTNSRIIRLFMVYQVVMVLIGIFFFTRSIILAFQGKLAPMVYVFAALVLSVSILIVIHELLHGLALKVTGAQKITYGGSLKKFIFYAEADHHVLNRNQFTLVALTPLVVVKLATLAGIVFTITQPAFYFWIFSMSAHSLFCAGDIGLLSFFYNQRGVDVFTFDVRKEKKTYFYKRIQSG